MNQFRSASALFFAAAVVDAAVDKEKEIEGAGVDGRRGVAAMDCWDAADTVDPNDCFRRDDQFAVAAGASSIFDAGDGGAGGGGSGDVEAYDPASFIPLDPALFDYTFYMPDLSSMHQTWTDDRAFLPSTITYGLTFAVGLTGNILVVLALAADRKARNVTSTFMVSLALADLLFLLVCIPYETATKFISYWNGGRILCKIFGCVEMLSALASVLNLTAVSVERYAYAVTAAAAVVAAVMMAVMTVMVVEKWWL